MDYKSCMMGNNASNLDIETVKKWYKEGHQEAICRHCGGWMEGNMVDSTTSGIRILCGVCYSFQYRNRP